MKNSRRILSAPIILALTLLNLVALTSPSATASANTSTRKSIGNWVSCSGTADDTAGVARAFAAARDAAFTLVVDCPVRLHIGMDIARPIFIDNGTTVQFSGAGKFTVDNMFIPAFVIANSSNISLQNWNVEYEAGLPVNQNTPGYLNEGRSERGLAGNAFNDLTLSNWLAANRGITFDRAQGVNSRWSGSTNNCAVFFLTGDTSSVTVTGMNVYVPANVGVNHFIPVVFSMNPNFRSNQRLGTGIPLTNRYYAIPHDLTFSNISVDGTYMGWVGNAYDVVIQDIESHRYGDLEDANGGNVGGVGKWFAPPHLFYFSISTAADPMLVNSKIHISNVADVGPRLGTARDKGGSDSISGYALSLKIACNDCTVDTYRSNRPDGLMDVLPSTNLTISNVTATFDSAFTNNVYPGWRFPSNPYTNVTFENITLADTAAASTQAPIGPATEESNKNLVFSNVVVTLNRWAGQDTALPRVYGNSNHVSLDYTMTSQDVRIVREQTPSMQSTLQASPVSLRAGGSSVVTWSSRDAQACSASGYASGGNWAGSIGTYGTRIVKIPTAGTYDLTLTCKGAGATSTRTLQLIATR